MSFDATQPENTTKIRNLGEVIRPNWEAIETANSSFLPQAVNFVNRDSVSPGISSDPTSIGTAYIQYCKEDSAMNPELFVRSTTGTITQMTYGDTINDTNGETFLPGGIILKWGSFTVNASTFDVIYTALTPALTAFPNATLNVSITKASTVGSSSANISALSASQFTITNTNNTAIYYFMAIGN